VGKTCAYLQSDNLPPKLSVACGLSLHKANAGPMPPVVFSGDTMLFILPVQDLYNGKHWSNTVSQCSTAKFEKLCGAKRDCSQCEGKDDLPCNSILVSWQIQRYYLVDVEL